MRIVLMGAPGSGKATQAKQLERTLGIPRIATGSLLRAAAAAGTAPGQQARQALDAGHLVPDDVVLELIRERLREPDAAGGFVLEGFPRSVAQAQAFDTLLAELRTPLDRVIQIDMPEDELRPRLLGRRVCSDCGAVFHAESRPPRESGTCDACGGELVRRRDDSQDAVERRLATYAEHAPGLLDYYAQRGLLYHVNGTRDSELVYDEIRALLS